MVVNQLRPKRKSTGGRYKSSRSKKLYAKGNLPTLTKLSERHCTQIDSRGNYVKFRLMSTDKANVYDKKIKKYTVTKIKTIVECPANRHYVRRNIMTKGTIIDTELGKAKITSRPGQSGTINAVLI